jgi:hypothetical protein
MDPNLKALLMAALTLAQAQCEKALNSLGNDQIDLKKLLTDLETALVTSLQQIIVAAHNQ